MENSELKFCIDVIEKRLSSIENFGASKPAAVIQKVEGYVEF